MGASPLMEKARFPFSSASTIIEVDGGQHNCDAHARRDAKRDRHFAVQGFTVLRFWNNDIDCNLDGVLMLIADALHNPPPGRPAADHPPPSGEG